ncbi:hypothetical protein [Paenibacillus sp. BIC5C1]|uniref:hypothetical protein n=1 Tax=Paenibacillus sp. BIC5C1 TaxID=3078263 RepID=UPI0028E8CCD3|nr:hypothetical protein [Paenibacillus sp. BIC5C1]
MSILGFKLNLGNDEKLEDLNTLIHSIRFGSEVNRILGVLDLDNQKFQLLLIESAVFMLKKNTESELLAHENIYNIGEFDEAEVYDDLLISSADVYNEIYGEIIQEYLTEIWGSDVNLHKDIMKLLQKNKIVKYGSVFNVYAKACIRHKKPLRKIMNPTRLIKNDLELIKENTETFLRMLCRLEDVSVLDEIYAFEIDTDVFLGLDLLSIFNLIDESAPDKKVIMKALASVTIIESPYVRREILSSIIDNGLGQVEFFIPVLMKIRYFILPLLIDFIKEQILEKFFVKQAGKEYIDISSSTFLYNFIKQSDVFGDDLQIILKHTKHIRSIKTVSINNELLSKVPYNINVIRNNLECMDNIATRDIAKYIKPIIESGTEQEKILDLLTMTAYDFFITTAIGIKD